MTTPHFQTDEVLGNHWEQNVRVEALRVEHGLLGYFKGCSRRLISTSIEIAIEAREVA
jgi:hypothetical protein